MFNLVSTKLNTTMNAASLSVRTLEFSCIFDHNSKTNFQIKSKAVSKNLAEHRSTKLIDINADCVTF